MSAIEVTYVSRAEAAGRRMDGAPRFLVAGWYRIDHDNDEWLGPYSSKAAAEKYGQHGAQEMP